MASSIAGAGNREAAVDVIAEIAGIAEVWPVAMAEALGVVKVGNIEWGLVNRTPCFSSAAMAGAVLLVDHTGAQAVRDEQDHVMRARSVAVGREPRRGMAGAAVMQVPDISGSRQAAASRWRRIFGRTPDDV